MVYHSIAASSEGVISSTLNFLDVLREHCQGMGDCLCAEQTSTSDNWCFINCGHESKVQQGWKIHVSSTTRDAFEVLGRCLPIILEASARAKFAATPAALRLLNSGQVGETQVGKFITIYPDTDLAAVRLSNSLDEATYGLAGIEIPTDRQLRPRSLVYHRYGAFGTNYLQTLWGESFPAIVTPAGLLEPDIRQAGHYAPGWVSDPFPKGLNGPTMPLPIVRRVLNDRLVLFTIIYQSVNSVINLGMDLEVGRPCIVKRHKGDIDDSSRSCEPDCRLRLEGEALRALRGTGCSPDFYGVVRDGGTMALSMEDIAGHTLEYKVMEYVAKGELPPVDQVREWLLSLLRLTRTMHENGYVHRDLKSSNVLVTDTGSVRLVDFELSRPIGTTEHLHGSGTRGYASPQQQSGKAVSVSDDIYSIGALIFYLITGSEPSNAPRHRQLLRLPLSTINPNCSSEIEEVIGKCLDPDPSGRYPDISSLEHVLERLPFEKVSDETASGCGRHREALHKQQSASGQQSASANAPEINVDTDDVRYQSLQLARDLAQTMCASAKDVPHQRGVRWRSSHPLGIGYNSRDINVGNAGSVLALAELAQAFREPEHLDILQRGALSLLQSSEPKSGPLPGLYVGESGVGTALLRAGQILEDSRLIGAALEKAYQVASLPFGSPDLFNGTAGRLRFHLLLWSHSSESSQLQAAKDCAESLLSTALESPEGSSWRIPSGYGSLSGLISPSYAHGAAGIGDSLLDLYEVTRDEKYQEAASSAAKWIVARRITRERSTRAAVDWANTSSTGDAGEKFWCNGAAGVGRFLLRFETGPLRSLSSGLIPPIAETVAFGTRWSNATQCHGLSGCIEFLLDAWHVTGNKDYRDQAITLASLILTSQSKVDGFTVVASESPIVFSPDYMVGYAGVALALLRVGDPRRPHQLSLRGFEWLTRIDG